MKTAREILLERHDAVNPQLDSLRELAIAQVIQSDPARTSRCSRTFESLREIFRIPRIRWIGLTAVWALIIALNLASSETSPPAHDDAKTEMAHRSADDIQALREQRRFFAELVELASGADTERPRLMPRPRSELPVGTATA